MIMGFDSERKYLTYLFFYNQCSRQVAVNAMIKGSFSYNPKYYFILITALPFARPVSGYGIASLVYSNGNTPVYNWFYDTRSNK